MKSILIAAPVSGSGKTTVTIGLMECLRRRGLKVAPFKVGPDFIDPGYHRLVTGRPSINLDSWICSPGSVEELFSEAAGGADIAVIEGVMGLFDGFGGRSEEGSSAQIAKLTGSTVFLVIDAKGYARSIAAVVKGFVEFDPELRIGGVIFNNVSGESHARILREAVESTLPGLRVLGCIQRDKGIGLPSRHLGLVTAGEQPLSEDYLDRLEELIRSSIDLGALWAAAGSGKLLDLPPAPVPVGKRVRLAIARDEAFCFVYESNLRLLAEAGAELVEFSPLKDGALPEGISGIYLPGGYPELHAGPLAANRGMIESVAAAVEAGMPVYAECGGFIYLTRGVIGGSGGGDELQPFVGIFPVTTRLLERRKALGYREVKLQKESILGPAGSVARGHEFHYSEMEAMPEEIGMLYQVSRGQSDLGREGYLYRNCLASYIHLHFGSNPQMAAALVGACEKFKNS